MWVNAGFHLLHLSVIALNIFGWLHPKTRKPALVVQLLTLACWLGFGLLDGSWGFCPLTYWQWQWLESMGYIGLPNNYVTYIASHWLGLRINSDFAAGIVLGSFSMALLMNLLLLHKERTVK